MTITPMQMYWITRLDSLGAVFGLMFVFGLVVALVGVSICFGAPNDHHPLDWKKGRVLKVAFGILALSSLGLFTPTTKEMAAILIIPKIVNNEKVQGLPEKVMGLADAWLSELAPENRGAK